jgi:predicted protein tyrosine phosphatase
MKKGKRNRRERWETRSLWDDWPPTWMPRQREWHPDRDWPNLPHFNTKNRYPIDFTFVTDRVATGGGLWTDEDVRTLRLAGITHVITAAEELHSTTARLLDGQMPYLLNGVKDDGATKGTWWFAKTVEFAREALADPDAKVYVHCWSGSNRGPSSAYAVLRDTGIPAAEAERLIRTARPRAHLLYVQDADAAIERMGAA